MPAAAIAFACAVKSGMPAPGISNVRTWRSIAHIGPGRIDLERGRHEVAVEEVVQVLVGRDARHHL